GELKIWRAEQLAVPFAKMEAYKEKGKVTQRRMERVLVEVGSKPAEARRPDLSLAKNYNGLGVALHNQRDYDEAILYYQEAIRRDPKLTVAHTSLGNALYARGNHDRAIASYKWALQIDPKNSSALAGLSRAERMRDLLSRLPAVLAGKAAPKTPNESCEF